MSDDQSATVGDKKESQTDTTAPPTPAEPAGKPADWPTELGGPKGPEPTRYGDWEQKGRCSDF